MFGKSHIFGKLFSNLQSTALRRRVLCMTLLLAFSFGSASQTAPAQAAPFATSTETKYHLEARLPEGKICAGRSDYEVTVYLIKNSKIQDPRGARGRNGPPESEKITGSARDAEIATLIPKDIETGPRNADGSGQATFKLSALKKGDTRLRIHAVPDGEYIKVNPEPVINVVNCGYSVKMNATDIDSRGGVTIWTTGNLEVTIKGDSGEMTGNGNFDFVSGFVGPPCTIQYSEFSNATTITGQVDDNDQLTLQFDYEPGQITSNVSCPGGGGSATHQIDLTNLGIASATFSASGGTRMFRVTYAGSDMAPGTMIINVQPSEEEAGG